MANLSPFQKETAIQSRLLAFLKAQKKGLTTTDILKATGIARKTLEKHLQLLASKSEISMKQYGPSRVYAANERISSVLEKLIIGDTSLNFEVMQNDDGKFLLVQEKEKKGSNWQVKGSVTIPIGNSNDFANALNKALKKIKKVD